MSDKEIESIAEKAKFIVSGYAFTEMDDKNTSILNLQHMECARNRVRFLICRVV